MRNVQSRDKAREGDSTVTGQSLYISGNCSSSMTSPHRKKSYCILESLISARPSSPHQRGSQRMPNLLHVKQERDQHLPHDLGPREDRLFPSVAAIILRLISLIRCTPGFQSLS